MTKKEATGRISGLRDLYINICKEQARENADAYYEGAADALDYALTVIDEMEGGKEGKGE